VKGNKRDNVKRGWNAQANKFLEPMQHLEDSNKDITAVTSLPCFFFLWPLDCHVLRLMLLIT